MAILPQVKMSNSALPKPAGMVFVLNLFLILQERVTGLEPVTFAWEANMIPLHHTRLCGRLTRHKTLGVLCWAGVVWSKPLGKWLCRGDESGRFFGRFPQIERILPQNIVRQVTVFEALDDKLLFAAVCIDLEHCIHADAHPLTDDFGVVFIGKHVLGEPVAQGMGADVDPAGNIALAAQAGEDATDGVDAQLPAVMRGVEEPYRLLVLPDGEPCLDEQGGIVVGHNQARRTGFFTGNARHESIVTVGVLPDFCIGNAQAGDSLPANAGTDAQHDDGGITNGCDLDDACQLFIADSVAGTSWLRFLTSNPVDVADFYAVGVEAVPDGANAAAIAICGDGQCAACCQPVVKVGILLACDAANWYVIAAIFDKACYDLFVLAQGFGRYVQCVGAWFSGGQTRRIGKQVKTR